VCRRLQRTVPPGCSACTTVFGASARRTAAPWRGMPAGTIRRVMHAPCLAAAGLRFLRRPPPAVACARSDARVPGASRPPWGYHVPPRQDTSGEVASRRRERGTRAAGPRRPAARCSIQDVSPPCLPFVVTTLRARLPGGSTRSQLCLASIAGGVPDFLCALTACGSPRDGSRRPSRMATGMWCSPGLVDSSPPCALRHLTYATSCRTSDSRTSVAYLGLADNPRAVKPRYNAPISHCCEGASLGFHTRFSTSWR
jgi:hypothetical protein